MEKTGWKVTAIVFICLFAILLIGLVWIMALGVNAINSETECKANICGDAQYDSYSYDDYENVCYCYTQGELKYQRYMG